MKNTSINRFLESNEAVTSIEYALLASSLVFSILIGATAIRLEVISLYEFIKDSFLAAAK